MASHRTAAACDLWPPPGRWRWVLPGGVPPGGVALSSVRFFAHASAAVLLYVSAHAKWDECVVGWIV